MLLVVTKRFCLLFRVVELVYQNFMNDRQFKAVIELISYNVLPFLTRKNMYNVAYQVLLRFEDDLDSLVRSRVSSLSISLSVQWNTVSTNKRPGNI